MNKSVSVVTTVRNGERYLEAMLESVRNQAYKFIEHIIVNDGSSDNSLRILQNYNREHPQYPMVIFNVNAIGRGRALNFAVQQSRGEYIAIIDADDLWHREKLLRQVAELDQNNWDLVCTKTVNFEGASPNLFTLQNVSSSSQIYKLSDLLVSNKISHSSVLMRKEICNYDENRKSQFDYDLWLKLLAKKRSVAIINLPLTFHRIHKDQSFEGKMKKMYRYRSYKLKVRYCLKDMRVDLLLFNTAKLAFDLSLPRKIRLYVRKLLKS